VERKQIMNKLLRTMWYWDSSLWYRI